MQLLGVDRKGIRLLEDNSDEVAGSESDPDVDWKGWKGRRLEGLLFDPADDVVVDDCSG